MYRLLCSLFFFAFLFTSLSAASEGTLPLEESIKAKAVRILKDGLASDEFWPAIHAAEGLTLGGHGDYVREQLSPLLSTEMDDQRRCGISRELVRAGDWLQAQHMLDILDKEDSYGHTHASESLYKVFEIGDGVGLRRTFEKTQDSKTKLMAAAALSRAGNPAAMSFIRRELNSEVEEDRKIAAWIIARIGDESDIPQLLKNLKSGTDPLAIAYTQHALALLGDKTGLVALKKNLHADDAALRTYAATFAGEVRDFSVADSLIKLLDDENLDTRIRAAQSLLMFNQPAPLDVHQDIKQVVYLATKENPRYTEGSVLRLANGNLLFAMTEFIGSGSDFAKARIVMRESSDLGRTWGPQRVLQESTGDMNVMSVTLRRLQAPHQNRIALFYLEKNSHDDLKVYVRFSTDEANTFGEPVLVTTETGYHVMNNDRVTQLSNGRLLVPVASTPNVKGGGHFTSRCWYSDDLGETWHQGRGAVDLPKRGAMEPEVIELENGQVLMIMRNQLGTISTSYSSDRGETWSPPGTLSDIVAPEAPATLRRIPSTGDLLLIWNNTFQAGAGHGGKRTPLAAAISTDEGKTWENIRNLENDPQQTYSYTSLTFVRNRAVLTHWVGNLNSLSAQYRSLPVAWFYK